MYQALEIIGFFAAKNSIKTRPWEEKPRALN